MDDRDLTPLPPQVYADPRPARYFARFYEHARAHGPGWTYDLARLLLTPYCQLVFHARSRYVERVPVQGPAIIAPNHFSAMDHFFCGIYLRRRVQFMAKSQLFKRPLLEGILRIGGAFPVRRGKRDEESIATAKAILERGGAIVIYPEGGRSRSARIGDRARPGIGRLALETGAPVVPVAIHGSQGARNWKRLRFARVTVGYGAPRRWQPVSQATLAQQQTVADEVLGAVRELYDEVEREAVAAGFEPSQPARATR
jgi:1-acyl-sn-glycerol-3-phosphate acyltransferase